MVSAIERVGAEFLANSEDTIPRALGNYVFRLQRVADKSFMHSKLLDGTTILNPSVIRYNQGGLLEEKTLRKFAMYTRELPLSDGSMLTTYPLKTVDITAEGQLVIADRIRRDWYSVVHVPADEYEGRSLSNPADLSVDFAFTVNKKDEVFTAGLMRPTPAEQLAFDAIVGELERRVAGVTPEDERLARLASKYR